MLLHAGDATYTGTVQEIIRFNAHLMRHRDRFQRVIFTPGNHDRLFEHVFNHARSLIDSSIDVLHDAMTEVGNIKIWGSGWTPAFGVGWAFNARRGKQLEEIWSRMPDDVDVLVTHGPPLGFGDIVRQALPSPREWIDRGYDNFNDDQLKSAMIEHVGCAELLHRIQKVKPRFVVCGHIHPAYGVYEDPDKNFTVINASSCNSHYDAVNAPVIFELERHDA